jgi:acetyl-CoA synthetase
LKVIGVAGEPMTHEAWEWLHHVVGEERCDIVDTWWQTETGAAAISPRPSEIGEKIVPGRPMKPLFGIQPVLMDEKVV